MLLTTIHFNQGLFYTKIQIFRKFHQKSVGICGCISKVSEDYYGMVVVV